MRACMVKSWADQHQLRLSDPPKWYVKFFLSNLQALDVNTTHSASILKILNEIKMKA